MLQSAQKELLEKVKSIEGQALDQENYITSLEKAFTNLLKENSAVKIKVNDLEGGSCQNKIKIVCIPVNDERNRPKDFDEILIPKLLGEENFQLTVIDCAHQTLLSPPPKGVKPCAINARVHFYQQKELILRLRRPRPLEYKGNRVMIFPDYTLEVMQQRQNFREVISTL